MRSPAARCHQRSVSVTRVRQRAAARRNRDTTAAIDAVRAVAFARARRIPRTVTVGVVYAVGIGGLVLLAALIVPVVADQGQQLVQKAPAYRERALSLVESARRVTGRWGGPQRIVVPEIGLKEVGQVLQQLAQRSFAATRGIIIGK